MRRNCVPLLVILTLLVPRLSVAEEAQPLRLPAALGDTVPTVEPTAGARALEQSAANSLPSALAGAADKLRSLEAWNAAHRRPFQNGFTRPIPAPLVARAGETLPAGARAVTLTSPAGDPVWAARFDVDRASRLRLHLEQVAVPSGTVFTVWGNADAPRSFGVELLGPAGDIWSPSIAGGTAFLEVRWGAPSGRSDADNGAKKSGFEIHELAEMFAVETLAGECLIDATCVSNVKLPSIAKLRTAIAHIEFVDGGDTYVCSGGLLNDTDNTTTVLYFLTANHCISTQSVASTLEAFWDFRTSSCNGAAPDIDSVPRSHGSTLLATSVQSDFALLRLASVPAGRTLLGWSSNLPLSGTQLSRISHPVPDLDVEPQSFSTQTYRSNPQFTCDTDEDGRPWGNLTKFLYSVPVTGGTFGGSSGSPVVNPNGQVVGQLLGSCGDTPDDGCSAANYDVDGAFTATFSSIAQYLSPGGGGSTCVPDGDTLCIDNAPGDRRFKVEVGFHTVQSGGSSGNGHAVPLNSLGITRGGLFWFFGADNPEFLIKVLDGCTSNSRFWVFYSGATNVGMTITVTDTANGHTFVRTNADLHALATVQDTSALSCN